jgi:hypothetical protein
VVVGELQNGAWREFAANKPRLEKAQPLGYNFHSVGREPLTYIAV